MAQPLVSVIVPTFNRPEVLNECLRSIEGQTFRHFEVVVVNDGGADVGNVVARWNTRGNIRYIRHPEHRGPAAARNTGIRAATGDYIAYLDDDDLYYPNHLETLVNFLESTGCRAAYTDAVRAHQKRVAGKFVVCKRDIPFSLDFDAERILVRNFIPTLCILHARDCLLESDLFDESLPVLEDWDLWIRISRRFPFAHIRSATCEFSWRPNGESLTSGGRETFCRTVEVIYGKYRELARANPRVAAGQRRYLRNAKALLRLSMLLGERSRAFQTFLGLLEKTYLRRMRRSPHTDAPGG